MLSKNNKILIGCLALLLVMSVGYALFSDTITINGSATAKGDFELTTTSADLTGEWFELFAGESASTGIIEKTSINVVDNVVTTSVTLGAPGSHHIFGIKIKNTGSIPAKLKSIEDITNNKIIIDSINGIGDTIVFVGESKENRIYAEIFDDTTWFEDYESDVTSGEVWRYPFQNEILNAVLDPEEEVYYFIKYWWGEESTTHGDPLELNWKIKINFEQVTE